MVNRVTLQNAVLPEIVYLNNSTVCTKTLPELVTSLLGCAI